MKKLLLLSLAILPSALTHAAAERYDGINVKELLGYIKENDHQGISDIPEKVEQVLPTGKDGQTVRKYKSNDQSTQLVWSKNQNAFLLFQKNSHGTFQQDNSLWHPEDVLYDRGKQYGILHGCQQNPATKQFDIPLNRSFCYGDDC